MAWCFEGVETSSGVGFDDEDDDADDKGERRALKLQSWVSRLLQR